MGPPLCLWGAATLRLARGLGAQQPLHLRSTPTLGWQRGSFPPSHLGVTGTGEVLFAYRTLKSMAVIP